MFNRLRVSLGYLRLQPRRLLLLAATALGVAGVVVLALSLAGRSVTSVPDVTVPVTVTTVALSTDIQQGPDLHPGVNDTDPAVSIGSTRLELFANDSAAATTQSLPVLTVRDDASVVTLSAPLRRSTGVTITPLEGQDVGDPRTITGSTLELAGLPEGGYLLSFLTPTGTYDVLVQVS